MCDREVMMTLMMIVMTYVYASSGMTFFATVMVALLMVLSSTVKAAMVVPVPTLQNIFVTGGSSQVDGFEDRLHAEVLAMRPFQSEFRVWSAGELVGCVGEECWCGV